MTNSSNTPGDPLVSRYAGRAMTNAFAPARRYLLWRDVWIALAEAQKATGISIPEGAIEELRAAHDSVPWDRVREIERATRHDVVAHIRAYGEQCPRAAAIIHLGATSADVTDNADILQLRDGLAILRQRLVLASRALRDLADREADHPCLGYTHYQMAQPVTLGKRASLWLQDLLWGLEDVDRLLTTLPLRGLKGATGTQASFLALCDGDAARVKNLERRFAEHLDFESILPVSGQTYPRSLDARILAALARVADAAAKFATDIRLLAHDGEVEEPLGTDQVGSSAMPYKRNPMRCERITALARSVRVQAQGASEMAATQWLERSLDDSAYRRLALPQVFLATDGILGLCIDVARGLVAWPRVTSRRLADGVPFLVAEEAMAAAVAAGGDRQDLHEKLRVHAREAQRRMREEGLPNDLLQRLTSDPAFAPARPRLEQVATDHTALTGLASQQTRDFLSQVADPLLAGFSDVSDTTDLPEV